MPDLIDREKLLENCAHMNVRGMLCAIREAPAVTSDAERALDAALPALKWMEYHWNNGEMEAWEMDDAEMEALVALVRVAEARAEREAGGEKGE